MGVELEVTEATTVQKPQVFIKSITFNDDTKLILSTNSIIVFTGANNCGKSQVLKDAEAYLKNTISPHAITIKCIDPEYYGMIDEETFINKCFYVNQQGKYQLFGSNYAFNIDALQTLWRAKNLESDLYRLFVMRLNTELRLTSSNALNRNDQPQKSPIQKLINNELLAQKLSDYFHQAFNVDLVVNRNEMQTIPLHIGKAPDKTAYTIAKQDDYYNQVSELPKLQDQGDGMRSFASILLDTFTSEYTITLIDEPEAFLHPPQARLMGKMLAKNNPDSRQLLIATHSEDFLQGLLDADDDNITVIRIDRKSNINKMNILQNSEIKKLWGNPILRYSNILSGLFHDKVVVCESDYDCLFYQSIIDAMYESNNEIAPDILFTHCGGKTRVKDVVSALKAVNVPVVAICDFDLINSSQYFKPVIESFELDWDTAIHPFMKTIYDGMNAKNSVGIDAWGQIKVIGKAGFSGDEPAAYERVEEACKSAGLFIIPVGEMECFDKTINKKKKEWVYHVLENYDLVTEERLESARKFIQAVVDYESAVDEEDERRG